MLIRVEWSAVNFKDAMVTRPGNRVARGFPLVPGVELTGSVEESTSPDFSPGQRVLVQGYDLGVAHHGGFAAYARVPADWVVPLPESLSCRNAAIIGLAGFTALLSLRTARAARHDARRRSHPGDRGLGGRGQRRRGHCWPGPGSRSWPPRARRRSRTTSKSSARRASWGAGSPRTTAAHSGPRCGPAWSTASAAARSAEALRTVRYGGAVAASGLTGGNDLTTTVYPFIIRGVALLGVDTVATPIEERRALWAEMPDAFPLDHCDEIVHEEIGLGGLTTSLNEVLDAAVRGRILVDPSARPAPRPPRGG